MWRRSRRWIVAALALGMLIPSSVAQGIVIHVDGDIPADINNGTNWQTAFNDLQSALDEASTFVAANPGSTAEIWVAAASAPYTPDPMGLPNPRQATFHLHNNVQLYGGFRGATDPPPGLPNGETDRDQQDSTANETILSGDLNDDDVGSLDDPSHHDNAFSVVRAEQVDSSAVVDGFTISGGNAQSGGGLVVQYASPVIANCLITGNAGELGGGMFCGGATSSPLIIHCRFEGNQADRAGGGVYNYLLTNTRIVDCLFVGNSAMFGGAILNRRTTTRIVRSQFIDNASTEDGGALLCVTEDQSFVVNCFFRNNTSVFGGAVMLQNLTTATLANCVFTANTAAQGGAMFSFMSADTTVDNCTFANNTATTWGGAIHQDDDCVLTLINSVVWDNADSTGKGTQDSQIYYLQVPPVVRYSCVQGWNTPGVDGNISDDPLLADVLGGNVHLQSGSPCVDTGKTADLPRDVADLDNDGDVDEPLPLDYDGIMDTNDICPLRADPSQLDSDGDGLGDACDACPHTIPGVDIDALGCPTPVPSDFDVDGDVDQADFGSFQVCLTGSGMGPPETGCEGDDLDSDEDVDLSDFGLFQRCMSGPNVPADPECKG